MWQFQWQVRYKTDARGEDGLLDGISQDQRQITCSRVCMQDRKYVIGTLIWITVSSWTKIANNCTCYQRLTCGIASNSNTLINGKLSACKKKK